MERWRQPVIPKAVEETPSAYSSDGHGWRKHLNWTLSPEDFARVKAGYVCVNCMEPHERPFPEKCIVCGFAMRKEQAAMVDWEYEGEKHLGPSTTMRQELDKLAEEKERLKPRKTSILLPGKDF